MEKETILHLTQYQLTEYQKKGMKLKKIYQNLLQGNKGRQYSKIANDVHARLSITKTRSNNLCRNRAQKTEHKIGSCCPMWESGVKLRNIIW